MHVLLIKSMLIFQQCFDEAEKHYDEIVGREKKLTRDDWAHGSLLIVNELLRCSNVEGEVRHITYHLPSLSQTDIPGYPII